MYNKLSKEIENLIREDRENGKTNPYAFKDENAIRRLDNPHDKSSVIRSNFIRDIDKIMNCPFFSRYQDKTQVFSLYKNDDITHRSLHVQFVSRIARTIGKALNLNLELIEAISLGHDIGHTPFGHAGEYILDELYFSNTKRHFYHNIQSARVLDKIFPYNITMQTLDGIISHNGETELKEYRPIPLNNFCELDSKIENCYTVNGYNSQVISSTLEGCVMRISDIIAYLGKDRQDAFLTSTIKEEKFSESEIGVFNAEIINNITVNIIENSYGKPYIKMDKAYFDALKLAKKENYEKIYFNEKTKKEIDVNLKPMMEMMYKKLLKELKEENKNSYIYKHHIDYINKSFYKKEPYIENEPNQIVVDFIASMTDDYFIDLFNEMFINSKYKLTYKGYFE